MPFFDYICPICEIVEEKLLSRTELDTVTVTCPKCQNAMRRMISNVDFKMKGAPPKNWQPRTKSEPKSEVRNIHEIRRVEETK